MIFILSYIFFFLLVYLSPYVFVYLFKCMYTLNVIPLSPLNLQVCCKGFPAISNERSCSDAHSFIFNVHLFSELVRLIHSHSDSHGSIDLYLCFLQVHNLKRLLRV